MIIQKALPIIYWFVAVSVTVAAIERGGKDERAGAIALFLASIASALAVWTVPVVQRLAPVQTTIFLIDVLLFCWFLWLALGSGRFWPLWATAFSLIVVATHVAHFATPAIVPRAYILAQGFWAYPTWLVIALGTLHRPHSRRFTAG
ncbi:hypothetical protein [Sphingomonas trueperi]|uniref:hypothetical protein n=1 Tax=Sphingomonas trueperi TaxID=53317 RepID=UPI0033943099